MKEGKSDHPQRIFRRGTAIQIDHIWQLLLLGGLLLAALPRQLPLQLLMQQDLLSVLLLVYLHGFVVSHLLLF
jgi:hypothetical protein